MAISRLNPVMMSGCIITFISTVVVILAFATPYWLVNDGRLADVRFHRLGLWEVCFERFGDPSYRHDRVYKGCMWILDEDYDSIHSFLTRPFFVAVQVLYTIGFVVLLLACLLLFALLFCIVQESELTTLLVLGSLMAGSGFLHTIAIIVFGALGDSRDWMPDPDNNYLSWSFGLGAVGSILQLIASVLFFLEYIIIRRKLKKQQQQTFQLSQVPGKTNHQ